MAKTKAEFHIDYVLADRDDLVVTGWYKGDATLELLFGEQVVPYQILLVERPDVGSYFGIRVTECSGFILYVQGLKAAVTDTVLHLKDESGHSVRAVPLEVSPDQAPGMEIVEQYKLGKQLPETLFEEKLIVGDRKYLLQEGRENASASGYVEVLKEVQESGDLLIIGWAAGKLPDALALKSGSHAVMLSNCFKYVRKDIEDAFATAFGQGSKNAGFIVVVPAAAVPHEKAGIYLVDDETNSARLVEESSNIERGIPYVDIQNFMNGIYTPQHTMVERVLAVDGPLSHHARRSERHNQFLMMEDYSIRVRQTKSMLNLALIVSGDYEGDLLNSIISMCTLGQATQQISLNIFIQGQEQEIGRMQAIAERMHNLFGCATRVFSGCKNLMLGNIRHSFSRNTSANFLVVDARSGLELCGLKTIDLHNIESGKINFFRARDVHGTSESIGLTELGKYRSESELSGIKSKFSSARYGAFACNAETFKQLTNLAPTVPMDEIDYLYLVLHIHRKLNETFEVEVYAGGLPFAKNKNKVLNYHESLHKEIQMYELANVGA